MVKAPDMSRLQQCAAIDMWWKECCTTHRVHQNPRKEYQPRERKEREGHESLEEPSFTLEDWDKWMAKEMYHRFGCRC